MTLFQDADNVQPTMVPPQDLRAEQATIAAVLLDGHMAERLIPELDESDFYRAAHRDIWRAVQECHRRRDPVELVTVTGELKRNGTLEETGGPEYLQQCFGELPTSAHGVRYAQAVKHAAICREVIVRCREAFTEAYGNPADPTELIERTVEDLTRIGQRTMAHGRARHLRDFAGLREQVEAFLVQQAVWQDSRPHFDIPDLDRSMRGLPMPGLTVLKGFSSSGKTALAMQAAWHWAHHRDHMHPTALFSLEMALAEQTIPRLLKMHTGGALDPTRLQLDEELLPDPRDLEALTLATEDVLQANLIHVQAAGQNTQQVVSQVRSLHRQHGVRFVVIDYLQRMDLTEGWETSVRTAANALKNEADRLGISVLAVSQVTVRQDGDEVAQGATTVENVADCVIHIQRHGKTRLDKRQNPVGRIAVEKNRNGPVFQQEAQFGSDLCWHAVDQTREEPENARPDARYE